MTTTSGRRAIADLFGQLKLSNRISDRYLELYDDFQDDTLRQVLASLHKELLGSFRRMNERLPTGVNGAHFLADDSRTLIETIENINELSLDLKNTSYALSVESGYATLLHKCEEFLKKSGGSLLPGGMAKIVLPHDIPLFIPASSLRIDRKGSTFPQLQLLGSGSYAHVYKFRDEFFQKEFALKRANKNLSKKEQIRFKREFEEMSQFRYPYILEVYALTESPLQYTMELADCSLRDFIEKNNQTLDLGTRKNFARQILRTFCYLESKKIMHRDISPSNILLKQYEEGIDVIKVSDFGLVKTPNSQLTTEGTDFKGWFNDPALRTEGFSNYESIHETYALTLLLYYVMTGRTKPTKIEDVRLKEFVERGIHPDKTKRFQSVKAVEDSFVKHWDITR